MAGVTELRLQRVDRTVMLRVAPVGPLRGLVDFPLQLRDRAPLAVDLEQRALLFGPQALLGLLRRLGVIVLFVQFLAVWLENVLSINGLAAFAIVSNTKTAEPCQKRFCARTPPYFARKGRLPQVPPVA
jgi:hypothetical protein